MIFRYLAAALLAVPVCFGVLYLMHLMIDTGEAVLTNDQATHRVEFVRVERTERVETRERKPEKPPEPEQRPQSPVPETSNDFSGELSVSVSGPTIDTRASVGALGIGVSDGEYLPIVKVAPTYPSRALTRRLEGYVMVEFTVTVTGAVRDVVVLESSERLFEDAAVEAALKFKYKPRVINGSPVEVAGVRNRIVFALESSLDSPA